MHSTEICTHKTVVCVQTDMPFKIKIEFRSYDFHAQNGRCSAKQAASIWGIPSATNVVRLYVSLPLSHLVGLLQPLKITLSGPNKTPVTIHTKVADSTICIGLAHSSSNQMSEIWIIRWNIFPHLCCQLYRLPASPLANKPIARSWRIVVSQNLFIVGFPFFNKAPFFSRHRKATFK